jgi:DNA-binding NarL/FixJ family response regulator
MWSFPIAVVRFGATSDIAQARKFLEPQVTHPCSEIVQAQVLLFDAYVAQRNGRSTEMRRYATEALERSAALGCYRQADLAQTLLPGAMRPSSVMVGARKPFSDLLSVLTAREQQIVELVLRGMTNRAIADVLSIKERTVEAHMTSIMSHIGVRSRYQLADQIAAPQT